MDPSQLQVSGEYDIIFCGGGSAACIAAGRLASAHPNLKILILEAGPHTNEIEAHFVPGQFFVHLGPQTSKATSFHVGTSPTDHLGGRTMVVQSARCVGGGSSMNWMMYTRASASDYDDWEKLGNPGWGSKDLIPLLKKMETYEVAPDLPTHGYDGPLKVSFGSGVSNVGHEFLSMTAAYDKERKTSVIGDINGLYTNSINQYSTWPKWIDSKTGRRSTAASYIYDQASNTNLAIAAGRRVKRVIVENGRAAGVEFVYDRTVYPDMEQTVYIVKARQLVVLSAGTFGSPTILERSGIGAKDILESNGIPCLVDLPGVGESYQDHQMYATSYLASEQAETMDDVFGRDPEVWKTHLAQWHNGGKGPFARIPINAGIKYRPSTQELKEIGPEFEAVWKRYFESAPDKALALIVVSDGTMFPDRSVLPQSKFFGTAVILLYPVSTGHVHIQSDDVYAPINFDPAMLKDPADLAALRWCYRKLREYGRRHPFYRGELGLVHPTFSETSEAAIKQVASPASYDAPDINWTKEDEAAIDEYVRKRVSTTWHSLGTCAMKPREKGGVVNPLLNVYGVERLKVVDLSIAPGNVGANTNSTAMVIGEKAAIIIAKELGFEL